MTASEEVNITVFMPIDSQFDCETHSWPSRRTMQPRLSDHDSAISRAEVQVSVASWLLSPSHAINVDTSWQLILMIKWPQVLVFANDQHQRRKIPHLYLMVDSTDTCPTNEKNG